MKERKSTFALVIIVVGTVIGAGFATGREISQYFARFGYWFIPCSIFAGLLFYLMYSFLLKVSQKKQFVNYKQFSIYTFGKWYFWFDTFLCVSFLIVCGSMYASVNQVQKIICPAIDFPFLSLLTAVLCVLVCLKGFSGLSKASVLTIPPIIILIIIICLKGSGSTGTAVMEIIDMPMSLLSCLLYVGMNIILAGVFLILVGNKYTKKQAKWATVIAISIITALLLLICTCLFNNQTLLNSEVPLLSLSFSFSDIYGYLFCIIIWCAVFSTIVASSFTCLNIICSKNQFLLTFVIIAIGYAISALGFSEIVKFVYPVIGVFGLAFVIITFFRFREKRK